MTELRDGTSTQDRRLDRLVQFDPRSRKYPIRGIIDQKVPRSYTWTVGTHLDQGYEGACVGFSWAHELIAKPKPVPMIDGNVATEIYRAAQTLDPWPGENYEGTSILAGAQAVQAKGYMPEYRWAFGLHDLRLALGYKGPAVLGLNWYEGMIDTDRDGYIRPTGAIVGGHAILAFSNSERLKRISLWNSWGPYWGINGVAHIRYEDMERLLYEQGEACIPVVRSL